MSRPLAIMVVAAEASGDVLGAGLMRALKSRLATGPRFVGVGGAQMAREGLVSPFDIAELSVLGIVEGVRAYPKVKRRVAETIALAAREKPDVAVLIDSWGFTLRVARGLKRLDPKLKVVKFVGPQVWASRPGRARTLAASVDHLLTILPFDAPFYEPLGLPVTFVGNPALTRDFGDADPQRFRAAIGAEPDEPILLVMPGSRRAEIERLGPVFGEAVEILRRDRPQLRVVVAPATTVEAETRAAVERWVGGIDITGNDKVKRDAMKAATLALACSGTATLELAMAGVPMVVGYRLGGLTHAILKRLVRTPWITLVNIAAGKAIVPELIQGACTGEALARELAARLDDPGLRARQTAEQDAALDRLGRGGDPFGKAAEVVLSLLPDKPVPPAPKA